jgi:CRISPR-associated protein Cmr6
MLPPGAPNVGLVFERYLRIWENDTSLLKQRADPLQQFVREYAEAASRLSPGLTEVHKRLDGLSKVIAGSRRTFETQERFVSGMGAAHPLENGFCFDYSVGVPCLPGSALKGLCLEVARDEASPSERVTLFGSGDKDEAGAEAKASAGDVLFFAAYPESWPKLSIDIINCHQSEYYGSEPIVLPARAQEQQRTHAQQIDQRRRVGPIENESPVPVFFLTVARNTKFIFRAGSRSGTAKNAARALDLLAIGLTELGIGAKTTLGYGVMSQRP